MNSRVANFSSWVCFVDPWMRYHWGWSDISAVDSHHAWAIGTCNERTGPTGKALETAASESVVVP